MKRNPELEWRDTLRPLGFPIPTYPHAVHSIHLTVEQGCYEKALIACRAFANAAPENILAWHALSILGQRLGHAEEWAQSRAQVARLHVLEGGFPTESRGDVENFMLAAEGASSEVPERVPEVYIAKIFDAYTDTFDVHLIDALHYQAHIGVANAAKRHARGRDLDVLDLGCGTGLVGLEMADEGWRINGVDISARMVERARTRDVYTNLSCVSIESYLQTTTERYDVVVAADVLIYVGELGEVLPLTRSVLRDGGLLVFSIEHGDDGDRYRLQPSRRYAHGLKYVLRMSMDAGFELISSQPLALRIEHDEDVAGEIVTLRATR